MNGEKELAKVKLVQFVQAMDKMNEYQLRKALSILRKCIKLMDQFLKLIEQRKDSKQ